MSIAPTHIHFAVSAPKATGRDYSNKVANRKVSEKVQSTVIERQRI